MKETFGDFETAVKAAEHFRQVLNYPGSRPVRFTITSPGKRNKLTCYGVFYNRPEFRGEDWFYMIIKLEELRSVFSRKHYHSLNGRDWYIAGYSTDKSLEEPYVHHHPFGHSVSLTAWNSTFTLDTDRWGHPVKQGTYPRLPISICDQDI